MRRNTLLVSIVVLGLVASIALIAGDGDDRDRNGGRQAFVGLWEAVDSYDGSTQRLSITCAHDETCEVRLNDSAFTLSCPNEIGFARGDGSIDKDVLSVVLTLTCAEANFAQFNEFVLDRRNGTLININTDPNPSNIFHKISR